MEFCRYIILALVLFEIIFYFAKYWKFVSIKKNIFYNYGIHLFKEIIKSEYKKEQLVGFVRDNIKPKKIFNDQIYLRRKYLKWVQWATPIPIQITITIKEFDKFCELQVIIKSLYFPWLAAISPIFISIFSDQLEFVYSIFSTVLFIILIYILALLEKKAIITKIRKIAKLDRSYSIFA